VIISPLFALPTSSAFKIGTAMVLGLADFSWPGCETPVPVGVRYRLFHRQKLPVRSRPRVSR
jgi:hypothetical protein